MSEALFLPEVSALPTVKVHPTAVMSILNSYIRRSDQQTRVIGTLMGVIKEGHVEVLGNVYSIDMLIGIQSTVMIAGWCGT